MNQSRAASAAASSVALVEQVGGARDDHQPALAPRQGLRLPVEVEDMVLAPDDEGAWGR